MILHDIFPTVKIVEYSLYYFLALLLLCIVALWYLVSWYIKHKKKTRGYYITLLENSLEDNPKHIAYKLSYYGQRIVRTPQQEEKLHILLAALEPIKYQRQTTTLDGHTRELLVDFLKILRHKDD